MKRWPQHETVRSFRNLLATNVSRNSIQTIPQTRKTMKREFLYVVLVTDTLKENGCSSCTVPGDSVTVSFSSGGAGTWKKKEHDKGRKEKQPRQTRQTCSTTTRTLAQLQEKPSTPNMLHYTQAKACQLDTTTHARTLPRTHVPLRLTDEVKYIVLPYFLDC